MEAVSGNGTHRSVSRRVISLAFPAIVSNITVPLLGLCDTFVSGHLGSPLFLGAISAGAMMLNVIFFLFGFLRMGSTGLTAEAFGASDRRAVSEIFSRSLWLALSVGVLVIFFSWPLCWILLEVIGASDDIASLSREYFLICIFGAPAQLGVMALSGWMVGMQSTVRPMIVAISVNIVNIALSLTVVFLFGLGFTGIAVGTLCANWFGFFLALKLAHGLYRHEGEKLLLPFLSVWKGGELKKFFRVNTNLFFRSACVMAVSLGVTSIGARLGDDVLAVNAVIMQFFVFFSYFMDGFAFAGEALVGKAYGARSSSELIRCVKSLLLWSGSMALFFFLIYWFFSDRIVEFITPEQSVCSDAAHLRVFILLLPPVSVGAFIMDGFYIGMIKTGRMLVATFSALLVFLIVAFVPPGVFSEHSGWLGLAGNPLLWTAFLAYLFLRGFILSVGLPALIRNGIK